ncbi:hypothetical protein CEUSTIGMA_g4101.t1 [Chlamydomonas eustigma]|uniref:Uncharacterized protein n=1 Tax=Chlamydomonas eustigma TaxID=1157962 RepID=A0A250X0S8_9CHLO|nr:hypothetical protein CEUSTIGMA_g4101.t1 [Chlamydomonas eustigma]|eukprot:GAX76655.1 hypothetical protein CEUSTIGMA_g4101.t1 [Chlamydomonas eustigma]
MTGDVGTVADPKIALREAGRKKLEDFKNKRLNGSANEKTVSSVQAAAGIKSPFASLMETIHPGTPKPGQTEALNEHLQQLENALDEAMIEETKLKEELFKINSLLTAAQNECLRERARAEGAEKRMEQVIERHTKDMAAAARSVSDAKNRCAELEEALDRSHIATEQFRQEVEVERLEGQRQQQRLQQIELMVQDSLSSKEDMVSELKLELQRATQEISVLTKKLADQEDEMVEMKGRLEAVTELARGESDQALALRTENERLHKQLSHLKIDYRAPEEEEDVLELKKQLANVKSASEEEEDVLELKKQLANVKSASEEEEDVLELKKQLANVKSASEEEEDVLELKKQLANVKSASEEQLRALQARLAEAESALLAAAAAAAATSLLPPGISPATDQVCHEVKHQTSVMAALEKELSSSREKLAGCEAELMSLQRQCAEMSEDGRKYREAAAVRDNQTAIVHQRIRVVENELEQAKTEANELLDYKRRVKSLIDINEPEARNLMKQLVDAQSEIAASKRKLAEAESKNKGSAAAVHAVELSGPSKQSSSLVTLKHVPESENDATLQARYDLADLNRVRDMLLQLSMTSQAKDNITLDASEVIALEATRKLSPLMEMVVGRLQSDLRTTSLALHELQALHGMQPAEAAATRMLQPRSRRVSEYGVVELPEGAVDAKQDNVGTSEKQQQQLTSSVSGLRVEQVVSQFEIAVRRSGSSTTEQGGKPPGGSRRVSSNGGSRRHSMTLLTPHPDAKADDNAQVVISSSGSLPNAACSVPEVEQQQQLEATMWQLASEQREGELLRQQVEALQELLRQAEEERSSSRLHRTSSFGEAAMLAEVRCGEARAEAEDLRVELALLQGDHVELKGQLDEAKLQLAVAEDLLQDARLEAEESREKLRRAVKKGRGLEEQLVKGQEQVKSLEEQLVKGQEHVQSLEEQLEKGQKQRKSLEEQLEKGQKQRKSLEEQIMEGQEKLWSLEEQLQAEEAMPCSQLEAKEIELKALHSQLAVMRVEADALTTQLLVRKAEADALSVQLLTSQAEAEAARSELVASLAEQSHLHEQLTKYASDLELCRVQVQSSEAEMLRLQGCYDIAHNELSAAVSESERLRGGLEEANAQAQAELLAREEAERRLVELNYAQDATVSREVVALKADLSALQLQNIEASRQAVEEQRILQSGLEQLEYTMMLAQQSTDASVKVLTMQLEALQSALLDSEAKLEAVTCEELASRHALDVQTAKYHEMMAEELASRQALEVQICATLQEIVILQSAEQALNGEVDRLKEMLVSEQAAREALNGEVDRLKEMLVSEQAAKEALNGEVDRLKEMLVSEQAAKEALVEEVKQLQSALLQMQASGEAFELEKAQRMQKDADLAAARQALEAYMAMFQEAVEAEQAAREAIEAGQGAWQQQQQQQQVTAVNSLQAEVQVMRAALIAAKEEVENVRSGSLLGQAEEVMKLREVSEAATAKEEGLRSELEGLEVELKDMRHQLSLEAERTLVLMRDLEEERSKSKTIEECVRGLEGQLSQVQSQVQELEEEKQVMKELLEETQEQVVRMKEETQEQVVRMKEETREQGVRMREQLEEAQEQGVRMKEQLEEAQEQGVRMKEQLEEAKSKVLLLELRVEGALQVELLLKHELENVKAVEQALRQKLEIAQAGNQTMTKQLEASQAEEQALRQQLETAQAEEQALRQQLESTQAEELVLKQQLEASQAEELALRLEIRRMSQQVAIEDEELLRQLRLKCEQTESEVEAVRSALQRAEESAVAQQIETATQVEQLEGELLEMQERADGQQSELSEARSRLEQLQGQLKQLQVSLLEDSVPVSERDGLLQQLEEEGAKLTESRAALSQAQLKLRAAEEMLMEGRKEDTSQLGNMWEELNMIQEGFLSETKRCEGMDKELREDLQALQASLIQAFKQMEVGAAASTVLQNEQEARLHQLQEDVVAREGARLRLEVQVEELREKLACTQQSLEQKAAHVLRLESQVDSLSMERAVHEQRVQEVQGELQQERLVMDGLMGASEDLKSQLEVAVREKIDALEQSRALVEELKQVARDKDVLSEEVRQLELREQGKGREVVALHGQVVDLEQRLAAAVKAANAVADNCSPSRAEPQSLGFRVESQGQVNPKPKSSPSQSEDHFTPSTHTSPGGPPLPPSLAAAGDGSSKAELLELQGELELNKQRLRAAVRKGKGLQEQLESQSALVEELQGKLSKAQDAAAQLPECREQVKLLEFRLAEAQEAAGKLHEAEGQIRSLEQQLLAQPPSDVRATGSGWEKEEDRQDSAVHTNKCGEQVTGSEVQADLSSDQIVQLESQLEALKAEAVVSGEARQRMEARLITLEAEVTERQSRCKGLEDTVRDLERLHKEAALLGLAHKQPQSLPQQDGQDPGLGSKDGQDPGLGSKDGQDPGLGSKDAEEIERLNAEVADLRDKLRAAIRKGKGFQEQLKALTGGGVSVKSTPPQAPSGESKSSNASTPTQNGGMNTHHRNVAAMASGLEEPSSHISQMGDAEAMQTPKRGLASKESEGGEESGLSPLRMYLPMPPEELQTTSSTGNAEGQLDHSGTERAVRLEAELTAANKKVLKLEADLAAAGKKVAIANSLTARVGDLSSTIDELQYQLAERNAAVEETKARCAAALAAASDAAMSAKTAEKKAADLGSEIEDLRGAYEAVRVQREGVESQLQDVLSKLAQYEARMKSAEESETRALMKDAELSHLTSQISILERQLAEGAAKMKQVLSDMTLRADLAEKMVEEEKGRAESAESRLAASLTALAAAEAAQEEIHQVKKLLEASEHAAKLKDAAAESAVAEAAKLRGQAAMLAERLRVAESQSGVAEEAIKRAEAANVAAAAAKSQLREFQQQYDDDQGELLGCRLRIEELEKQLPMRRTSASGGGSFSARIEMEAEVVSLRERLLEFEGSLVAVRSQLEESQQLVSTLKDQQQAMRLKCEESEEVWKKKEERSTQHESKLSVARDTVQRLQQDRHALIEELEVCKQELEHLKVSNCHITDMYVRHVSSSGGVEGQEEQQQQAVHLPSSSSTVISASHDAVEVAALLQEVGRLREELGEAGQHVLDLAHRNSSLELQVKQLQSDINAAHSLLREAEEKASALGAMNMSQIEKEACVKDMQDACTTLSSVQTRILVVVSELSKNQAMVSDLEQAMITSATSGTLPSSAVQAVQGAVSSALSAAAADVWLAAGRLETLVEALEACVVQQLRENVEQMERLQNRIQALERETGDPQNQQQHHMTSASIHSLPTSTSNNTTTRLRKISGAGVGDASSSQQHVGSVALLPQLLSAGGGSGLSVSAGSVIDDATSALPPRSSVLMGGGSSTAAVGDTSRSTLRAKTSRVQRAFPNGGPAANTYDIEAGVITDHVSYSYQHGGSSGAAPGYPASSGEASSSNNGVASSGLMTMSSNANAAHPQHAVGLLGCVQSSHPESGVAAGGVVSSLLTWPGMGDTLPRRISLEYLPLTAESYVRTAGPRVRQAAMYLDRGMALAGGLLAQVPGARLGLVAYLVLIHLCLWINMALKHHAGQCIVESISAVPHHH